MQSEMYRAKKDEYFFEITKESPIIVQIGMCHTDRLVHLRAAFPQSIIILYEPRNVINPDIHVCYYRKAVVGCVDGMASFTHYPGCPQASCIGEEDLRFGPAQYLKVPCVSMETVLRENDLNGVDVLLLDCEGSEFAILDEILGRRLPVEQIHVEVDLDKGPWDKLHNRMLKQYYLIEAKYIGDPDPSPLFLFRRKHE